MFVYVVVVFVMVEVVGAVIVVIIFIMVDLAAVFLVLVKFAVVIEEQMAEPPRQNLLSLKIILIAKKTHKNIKSKKKSKPSELIKLILHF